MCFHAVPKPGFNLGDASVVFTAVNCPGRLVPHGVSQRTDGLLHRRDRVVDACFATRADLEHFETVMGGCAESGQYCAEELLCLHEVTGPRAVSVNRSLIRGQAILETVCDDTPFLYE